VIQASGEIPGPAVEELAAAGRERGAEVRIASPGSAVEPGFDLLRLSTLPASELVRSAVLVFPIELAPGGFVFGGHPYRGADEAVRLTTSTRGEIIVLGNSAAAVLALAGRWIASPGTTDYEVLSGEVSRDGRFERRDGRLVVDPATDRDRIALRDAYFAGLKRRTRGAIVWEYPGSAEGAASKWEKTAGRFFPKVAPKVPPKGKGRLTVRLYPDAVTKAILTGSARPADLAGEAGALRVELDASAPVEPDLVTPVLAAAGLATGNPALLKRPVLLAAEGARRAGRWWGRDVKTFGAFTRAAGVDPSIADVLVSGDSISPVLDVGAVASWLDAGARLESEAAVGKALGQAGKPLGLQLSKWRAAAERQSVKPPPRRELPPKLLRGVLYPAPEALEDSFVSTRSREAIARLAAAGFGSIALRPGALMRDPQSSEILFVRRGARGETDEGLVHAIGDAHAAGMTAAVSPELLVGGGVAAGQIEVTGATAWAAWFAAYRRLLVHEAVVAEAAGVDLFVVGAGLTSTELEKNEWKHAIAAVRLATGAALTYATATPAGAPDVPFWDVLDAIGVELPEPPARKDASDEAIAEGTRNAVRPLAALSKRFGNKPVIVTRAGYESPRAIAALYLALSGENWWRGVYWPPFDAKAGAAEKAVLDGFRAMENAAP
jgi:hypothetical protein